MHFPSVNEMGSKTHKTHKSKAISQWSTSREKPNMPCFTNGLFLGWNLFPWQMLPHQCCAVRQNKHKTPFPTLLTQCMREKISISHPPWFCGYLLQELQLWWSSLSNNCNYFLTCSQREPVPSALPLTQRMTHHPPSIKSPFFCQSQKSTHRRQHWFPNPSVTIPAAVLHNKIDCSFLVITNLRGISVKPLLKNIQAWLELFLLDWF